MTKFTWSEKYSLGIKEIDEQHRHFFEMVSDIIKTTGEDRVHRKDLLFKVSDFNNYSTYHMMTEEDIFNRYEYPETKEHIEAHNAYRLKMKEFIYEAEKDDTDTKKIASDLATFAGSWLINHIMDVDQRYVKFMHKNRIG